jgi:opacity protein-like surface antigen
MQYMKWIVVLAVLAGCVTVPGTSWGQGADVGSWSVSVNGGYSQPVGELSNWYKGKMNGSVAAIYQARDRVGVEFRLTGLQFDSGSDELGANTTTLQTQTVPGEADYYLVDFSSLTMEYKHVGVSVSAIYSMAASGNAMPYIMGGLGLYRWNYIRGEWNFPTDQAVPAELGSVEVPEIERAEYSFGYNMGAGVSIKVSPQFYLDLSARWEGVFGTLWPTFMIAHDYWGPRTSHPLEQVQPIQSLNLNVGIKVAL